MFNTQDSLKILKISSTCYLTLFFIVQPKGYHQLLKIHAIYFDKKILISTQLCKTKVNILYWILKDLNQKFNTDSIFNY
jgi:hypothetical protein